jgi:hypothetical protein
MGAIGGLAEQPLQSVHNSDSLIKGVSKGLIGLITKPVGAVAELVNQTGQGLLRITGGSQLLPPIQLRLERKAINKEFSRYPISATKCVWKLIASSEFNRVHVNAMIDAVVCHNTPTSNEGLTGCHLILSDDILYIVDKTEDMLLRAFYLSQIDITVKRNNHSMVDSSVLVVTLHSSRDDSDHSNQTNSANQASGAGNLDRLVE